MSVSLAAQYPTRLQFFCLSHCCRRRQQVAVRCVCLLLLICAPRSAVSSPSSCICVSRWASKGMIERPGMMPDTRAEGEKVQKGCCLISSTVARFRGSVQSMRPIRSIRASLAWSGTSQVPSLMMRQSSAESGLSKGRQPKHMAQRMTPVLQRSTFNGSQGFPASISGAAQQGLPQAVVRVSPRAKMLLRPKSTSLTLNLQSRSTFQGLRSRWTTPISCKYSTAPTNCCRNLAASNSDSFSRATMWSKSSPLLAYSVTTQQYLWSSRISSSWTIFGWRTFRRILSYLARRCRSAAERIFDLSMSLIATCSCEWTCLAILTLLKVPQPMVLPTRQSPMRAPSLSSFLSSAIFELIICCCVTRRTSSACATSTAVASCSWAAASPVPTRPPSARSRGASATTRRTSARTTCSPLSRFASSSASTSTRPMKNGPTSRKWSMSTSRSPGRKWSGFSRRQGRWYVGNGVLRQVHDSIDHFVFDDLIFQEDDRKLIAALVEEDYEEFTCEQIAVIIPKLIKSYDYEDGHFTHLRNYLIAEKEKVATNLGLSMLNLPEFRWKDPGENAYRFHQIYEQTLKELNTKFANITNRPKKLRLKYIDDENDDDQRIQFTKLIGTNEALKDLQAVQIYCVWDVDDSQFQLAVVDAFIKLPYLRSVAIYTSYQVTSTEFLEELIENRNDVEIKVYKKAWLF